jgi:hypothetical protein
LIGGRDLMDLGMKPGPRFREILEAVQSRQLEGGLVDRAGALEFVRKTYLESV